MPHLLPKIIKFRGKLFREANFSFANCKGYRYKKERILVEPDGEIFHHYTMQDNQVKGF